MVLVKPIEPIGTIAQPEDRKFLQGYVSAEAFRRIKVEAAKKNLTIGSVVQELAVKNLPAVENSSDAA